MKALIQRVKQSSVSVNKQRIGHIDQGLLILLGVGHDDNEADAKQLLEKIIHYRIFADTDNKMNLSLAQINGEMLIISQFTLMANTGKGRRPSFTTAAKPDKAEQLYEYFIDQAKQQYQTEKIQTGLFGADMQIALVNDGPVTFMLET
jgi:D-tyrosyl-tRNA(Tyr) deacylase